MAKLNFKIFILLFLFIFPVFADAAVLSRAPNNLGLVGYWAFNEGVGAQAGDSSGNGLMLVMNGTSWVNGKLGKALSFNGTSDYIPVSNGNGFLGSNYTSWSVALWFKAQSTGALQNIYIENENDESSEDFLRLGINTSETVVYAMRDSAGTEANTDLDIASSGTYLDNSWHHAVITTSNKEDHVLYIDGMAVNSNTVTISTLELNRTDFGSIDDFDNPRLGYFKGSMDDIRLYSRALSPSEVLVLYKSGSARINPSLSDTVINSSQNNRLTNGLVGLWSFNGADINWTSATAGTAIDRAGSTNGTLTNMNRSSSPISGKVGQALRFDGSEDYINIGDVFYSDQFSVCTWLKPSLVDANPRSIVVKRNESGITDGADDNEWSLTNSNSGVNFASWQSEAVTSLNITGATVLDVNNWYHICGVQRGNGNTGYVYVNGVEDGSGSQTSVMRNDTTPIQVGVRTAGNNNRYWNGIIDEVRLYNRALSATEVKQLYLMGR